ncbi:MAG: XRE family transcriptional regulator [Chloroflexi bacterium]|nr:XRE family transcriptional regulator [Chloroflexota bacterium]
MATEARRDLLEEGEEDYRQWQAGLVDTPEKRALYDQIAARSDLWLDLVEARRAAGLTQRQLPKRLGVSQAQVARIEKRGYDACTLNTLRRYVKALGETFDLRVTIENTAKERASAA